MSGSESETRSEYRKNARALLAVQSLKVRPLLLPPPPFILSDVQPGSWPKETCGDLCDEEDQQLSAAVCRWADGLSATHWDRLSEAERIPWIEAALAAKLDADVARTAPELDPFADENYVRINEVAKSDDCADDKMRAICGLDKRFLGYTSSQWADALGVSDAAIRKTQFWKVDRKLAIGEDL